MKICRVCNQEVPYSAKSCHGQKPETVPDNVSIPEPLFSCHFDWCREEVSYPPDMLYWCEAQEAWVCDNCFEDAVHDCERGISLLDYLKAKGLEAAVVKPIRKKNHD